MAFLGLSEVVFVTEESSSMISEAISARKPIFTIACENANPDSNYQNILEKFTLNQKIKRINIFKLNKLNIPMKNFDLTEQDTFEELAKKFKSLLMDAKV